MSTLKTLRRPEVELESWPVAEQAVKPPPGLVCDFEEGHYYKSREKYLRRNAVRSFWRQRVLAWLRDHVNPDIPRLYYNLILGHDLQISTYAECYVRHFHYGQPDPFTGRVEYHVVRVNGEMLLRPGWWENVGLFSCRKVVVAFRDFEIDQLITESSEYGDFKFHRVGTDSTAESNTQTDLIADAGITTAAGSQVEQAADIYKTVSTITADAQETWNEHCVRSQTGLAAGTMVDRSVQPGSFAAVSVEISDTCEFTYQLTKNEEA